jgi:hypothetical protein
VAVVVVVVLRRRKRGRILRAAGGVVVVVVVVVVYLDPLQNVDVMIKMWMKTRCCNCFVAVSVGPGG